MNTDAFSEAAHKDPYLKKYLDLNNYSFAIQHKLAGDMTSFKKYLEKIELSNLTLKQQHLLKQPRRILKILLKGKGLAENFGFRLSSFK